MKENENLAGWQYIWWLFTIFGLPITIPWFIYHFSSAMTLKNRKSALQGKVRFSFVETDFSITAVNTMFVTLGSPYYWCKLGLR